MEAIKVLISWDGKNYSAGTGQVNGIVIVTDKNINALKSKFEDAFRFHIETSIEDGDEVSNDLKKGNYILNYEFINSVSKENKN